MPRISSLDISRILTMTSQGYQNKIVAEHLGVSVDAVSTWRRRLDDLYLPLDSNGYDFTSQGRSKKIEVTLRGRTLESYENFQRIAGFQSEQILIPLMLRIVEIDLARTYLDGWRQENPGKSIADFWKTVSGQEEESGNVK